jgi:Xaa-Pro aminopeptidase
MPLDIAAVQRALSEDGVDAWLLCDFRGGNQIAAKLVGLTSTKKLASRRWYYLIPQRGEPRGLVHAIERHNLDHLPGRKLIFSHRQSLTEGLRELLAGVRRVAMEYAPGLSNPYLSRVDAGTIEAVRELGVEVVSSGDLAQRFEGLWDARALELHRQASERLYRVKDKAFEEIRRRLAQAAPTTEFDIQQAMLRWFAEEALVTDSDPNVSAQENAGNPHYQPTAEAHRAIGPNEVVLIDLWAKRPDEGAVYADITWVGFTGPSVPAPVVRAFDAVARARDAAAAFVQERVRAGEGVRGYEVDAAARRVLESAGYARDIWHRTGHSLGEDVHGNGVHMDDYETHDERRLLSGTGFTIEPGIYFPEFGVRTEINMFVNGKDALVSGPVQERVLTLVP